MENTEEMKKMPQKMKGYTEIYLTRSREICQVVMEWVDRFEGVDGVDGVDKVDRVDKVAKE